MSRSLRSSRHAARAAVLAAPLLLVVLLPGVAEAAVRVSAASVSDGRLSISGTSAARRTITVDGVAMTRSDRRGRFSISRSGYTPPSDCRVDVNDGSSSPATVSLAGCTPAATTPPEPAPTGTTVTVGLSSVTVDPGRVEGGSLTRLTVTLEAPAPSTTAVRLASSNSAVVGVATQVAVFAGATSASINVTTQRVTAATSVDLSGTLGGITRSASLELTPVPPPAGVAGTISAVTLSPSTLIGGQAATGTAVLGAATTEPTVVGLSTSTGRASVPASVTVPAGQRTATFPVTTTAGEAASVLVIGRTGTTERGTTLTLQAAPVGPAVSSVTLLPTSVQGGGAATARVTLSAASPDGSVVDLSSSNPSVAAVGTQLVIPRGASAGDVAVSTTNPAGTTPVTITATARGGATGTASGRLTVAPATAAPAVDRVTIQSARWRPGGRGGTLTVSATSTNPNAILRVYTQNDAFLMQLRNNGGGRYSGSVSRSGTLTGPIVVRSSFGGSATAPLRR